MDIQIIALIILINLLFYLRTLKYPGICDDIPVFNQTVEIPKGWWMYFWYHLFGRKYKEWKLPHILTLFFHTLNCILIYMAFGSNYISAIAALLFSVNPVNNQCSIWISGRVGYSMNTTFALLMWLFPLASPLIYLFATYFCGASIILFPLIFLFTKYWWLSALVGLGFWRESKRIFSKEPNAKFQTESNIELKSITPRKIIIALKSLGYYFINALFALRLGYYHKYLFLHGVNVETNKESYKIDKYFFIGIGVILLTLYTMIWTKNIGMAWFCLCISQWCNVISFNQTITNRYIYMPNVGLTLFISSLLLYYPPLAMILFTYYATKLIPFLIFYKNEYWSIEHSCMEQPDFFYPWQNRAVHCFQNNNYHGALGNMLKANELRPNDWKILYNLSQIYMLLGNLTACKEYYELALKTKIDGREEAIKGLMLRLKNWIDEVESQAKNNNTVNIDIRKFDMQR